MTVPLDRLAAYPGALAWYVLGSVATGTMRSDSDLDLAVLPLPGVVLDRAELIRWAGSLAIEVGREVDVGVVESSNLVYAKEALTKGQRLVCSDPSLADRRASELLSLYLTFQEDRKEVLDAYRAG
jgi:predicted nucleotidyltransferase